MRGAQQSLHDSGGAGPGAGAGTGAEAGGVVTGASCDGGGITGIGGGGGAELLSDGQRPLEGRTNRASNAATAATLNAAEPEDIVTKQSWWLAS
jgi:hypothetical protein